MNSTKDKKVDLLFPADLFFPQNQAERIISLTVDLEQPISALLKQAISVYSDQTGCSGKSSEDLVLITADRDVLNPTDLIKTIDSRLLSAIDGLPLLVVDKQPRNLKVFFDMKTT